MAPAAEQRIIVGLSGGQGDPNVVRTAMDLARALDTVLYAVDVQPGGRPAAGAPGTPRMQDAYFALSRAGGLPDDVDVRIVVVEGDPGGQLVRLASRPTDVLVVGRDTCEEKAAIAWDCVAHAACPVLVVPPQPPPPGPGAAAPRREDATVAR